MKYLNSIVVVLVVVLFMCTISSAQYDDECHYECSTTYCDLFDDYCDYDCYEVCYPYRYSNVMRSISNKDNVSPQTFTTSTTSTTTEATTTTTTAATKTIDGVRHSIKSSSSARKRQPSSVGATFSSSSVKARTGKVVKMRIQNPSSQHTTTTTRGKASPLPAGSVRNHASHQTSRIALFQGCMSSSRQSLTMPTNS